MLKTTEIDAAKGIVPTKMPQEWYVWGANKIKDSDSEEEIQLKLFNQSICAHKKPYFFQYNYLSLKREYDKYKKIANENSIAMFKKTIDEMLLSDDLTDIEKKFIQNYKNNSPLDESPGTMNRICWAVEREMDDLKLFKKSDYSCLSLVKNINISKEMYCCIESLCMEYKQAIKQESKKILTKNAKEEEFEQSSEDVLNYYINEMYYICSNEDVLCDILIDLCYIRGYSKDILWKACGNVIVDRLLVNHDYKIKYPLKSYDPDFICCGNGFKMVEMTVNGGENNE